MAICKNCGTSFDSFYNLCPKCGTRYDPSENMAAPIVSPPETMPFFPDTPPPYLSENQNHPAKSKKTKTILIISIIAACILVIGAAAVIILINTLNHHTQYSDQLSLGEKYLSVENYDEAIKALKKAIEIDPNNPEPYLLLADAYIGKGDYANALAVLQQGYEITADPDIKKKLSVVRVLSDTFEQSSDSVSSESSLQESSVQESSQPVSSQPESSDESSVPDILATVYFRAPEYWKDAYAHVYDENHTYNDDSGIAMTLIDPDTHLYECIILNDISYNNPLIVFTTKTEGLRASRRSSPKSGGFEMEDGKTYVHDSYEEESSVQKSSQQESSVQESSVQEKSNQESSAKESYQEESSKSESSLSSSETDWKSLYRQQLLNYMNNNSETAVSYSCFELLDVDYDHIPELFISEGSIHYTSCFGYAYDNGSLTEPISGVYGELQYCKEEDMILTIHGYMGHFWYIYYRKTATGFEKIIRFDILGAYSVTNYQINEKEVTKEEYNLKESEYNNLNWIKVGRKTTFTEDNINAELAQW